MYLFGIAALSPDSPSSASSVRSNRFCYVIMLCTSWIRIMLFVLLFYFEKRPENSVSNRRQQIQSRASGQTEFKHALYLMLYFEKHLSFCEARANDKFASDFDHGKIALLISSVFSQSFHEIGSELISLMTVRVISHSLNPSFRISHLGRNAGEDRILDNWVTIVLRFNYFFWIVPFVLNAVASYSLVPWQDFRFAIRFSFRGKISASRLISRQDIRLAARATFNRASTEKQRCSRFYCVLNKLFFWEIHKSKVYFVCRRSVSSLPRSVRSGFGSEFTCARSHTEQY